MHSPTTTCIGRVAALGALPLAIALSCNGIAAAAPTPPAMHTTTRTIDPVATGWHSAAPHTAASARHSATRTSSLRFAASHTVPGPVPAAADCPWLMVLEVSGTGESSQSADPHVSAGMLGTMIPPMLAAGTNIGHLEIPYDSSFGGAPGTGAGRAPFISSVQHAVTQLSTTAHEIASRCPFTKEAIVGYSQGAIAAAEFARQIGSGRDGLADRIAGVALVSDGTRPPGPNPFPGDPGRITPAPAPGTTGTATTRIQIAPPPASAGLATGTAGFGTLDDRVAEFCARGDLACDAPHQAAALRTAAGLAASADLHDPIAAATTLGAAWQKTAASTTTAVTLDDIHLDGNNVNYRPSQTISDRLAAAADPRTPPPSPQQLQATSDKLARVASAVIADPIRQIPQLAGQIGAALGANTAANADLLNPATIAGYADTLGHHTGYGSDGTTQHVGTWFAALSNDIAGGAR